MAKIDDNRNYKACLLAEFRFILHLRLTYTTNLQYLHYTKIMYGCFYTMTTKSSIRCKMLTWAE